MQLLLPAPMAGTGCPPAQAVWEPSQDPALGSRSSGQGEKLKDGQGRVWGGVRCLSGA